jgi:hypothetical protein
MLLEPKAFLFFFQNHLFIIIFTFPKKNCPKKKLIKKNPFRFFATISHYNRTLKPVIPIKLVTLGFTLHQNQLPSIIWPSTNGFIEEFLFAINVVVLQRKM